MKSGKKRPATSTERILNKRTIITLVSAAAIILALTALISYAKGQQIVRDSKRRADLSVLFSRLERYHARKGYYPSLSQLNDMSFRHVQLGLQTTDALQDPKWSPNNRSCSFANNVFVQDSTNPALGCYAYQTSPTNCNNNTGDFCRSYILTANQETAGRYTIKSLGRGAR